MPEADSHPESNRLSHHFHTYISPLFILIQMYILLLWSLFQPAQHVLIILFASKMALQLIVKEKYHDLLKTSSYPWISDVFSTVFHQKSSMFHFMLFYGIISQLIPRSYYKMMLWDPGDKTNIITNFKVYFDIVMSELMFIFTI